ncbi:MAG: hypothetical protein Q7S43_02190 [bacterium]|nr:hypothetical protein [bacterium]
MAEERLSLLQKQILELYQENPRELNIKRIGILKRKDIARHLQDKTEKIYRIPRRGRYASDKESFAEIIEKMPLIAQIETMFESGKVDKKTKEKTIKSIEDSLSPDTKEILNNNRERKKLHKDYDKRQVSLTRSLKSLVRKGLLSPSVSYKKPSYFITPKGLETNLE